MIFHKRTSMSIRSFNCFKWKQKKIILQKSLLNALSSTGKLHIQNSEDNNNFCGVFTEYRGTILIKGLSYVSEKFITRLKKNIFDCCYWL